MSIVRFYWFGSMKRVFSYGICAHTPTTPNLSNFLMPSISNSSSLHFLGDLRLICFTTGEAFGGFASSSKGTSARQRGGRNAPVSCRAYGRPPLRFRLRCHSPSVLSRALPSATPSVAKPHDSTSALWHGVNNRPKGHCGPLTCSYYGEKATASLAYMAGGCFEAFAMHFRTGHLSCFLGIHGSRENKTTCHVFYREGGLVN